MWTRRPSLAFLIAISALTPAFALARGEMPQGDNEVTRLLEKLSVNAPHHYRGLTLFSLELSRAEDEADYASLDEGVRQGILRIHDTGVVRQVTMENVSGHQWVFAMSGEVIQGGKQNRMLRDDVLLPPRSGPVEVPTYCVEKGRWVGADAAAFGSGRTLSNYALRQKAIAGASQNDVWGQVDAEQRRFRVESATQDYQAVASSPAVARELDGYRSAFVRIWRPRTVGVVVAQGNHIVGADVLCNTGLFWKLRDKLIDSYAFDCINRFDRIRPSLRQEDARDFMARIYTARFGRQSSPGAGERLGFSGTGVEGAALAHRNAVIHLHATPGYRILPPPMPRPPMPIHPLPEPRDR